MTCPQCGKEASSLYCVHCGAATDQGSPVDATETVATPVPEPPMPLAASQAADKQGALRSVVNKLRRLKRGPAIGLAALAAILVAAVGVSMASGSSASSDAISAPGEQATPEAQATTATWWTSVDACLATAHQLADAGFGSSTQAGHFVDDYGNKVNGSTYQDAAGNWHQSQEASSGPGADPSSILGQASQSDNAMINARMYIMAAAGVITNAQAQYASDECQSAVNAASGQPAVAEAPAPTDMPSPDPTSAPPVAPPVPAAVAGSPLANVDWSSAKHPLDCSALGHGVEIYGKDFFDVTGDGVKDALVRVACHTLSGAASDQVEVFDGGSAPSAPRLLGVLNPVSTTADAPKKETKTVTATGSLVTLSGLEWSANAAECCGDIAWTQTFTWSGGKFQPGATKRHAV